MFGNVLYAIAARVPRACVAIQYVKGTGMSHSGSQSCCKENVATGVAMPYRAIACRMMVHATGISLWLYHTGLCTGWSPAFCNE